MWLGWWLGGREFLGVTAELINISRGGALVHLASPPSILREVWICVGERADASDCLLAMALEVTRIHDGLWLARLEFVTPLPHFFVEESLSELDEQHSCSSQAVPLHVDSAEPPTPPAPRG